MAATAQDPSAPLRGPEKKDEDRDDESTFAVHLMCRSTRHVQQATKFLFLTCHEKILFGLVEPAEKRYLMVAAEYSPFYAIEKGAVLQEARCFNDPHIDSRRCQQVQIHVLDLGIPLVSSLILFRCVASQGP